VVEYPVEDDAGVRPVDELEEKPVGGRLRMSGVSRANRRCQISNPGFEIAQ
jgi:hypothetical protein